MMPFFSGYRWGVMELKIAKPRCLTKSTNCFGAEENCTYFAEMRPFGFVYPRVRKRVEEMFVCAFACLAQEPKYALIDLSIMNSFVCMS